MNAYYNYVSIICILKYVIQKYTKIYESEVEVVQKAVNFVGLDNSY